MLDLYILLKSALKMQEMPFQRPQIQNFSGTLEMCRNCLIMTRPAFEQDSLSRKNLCRTHEQIKRVKENLVGLCGT